MSLRTLYLESFAGIAGDMFAASVLDAGLVEAEELQAVPDQLGFDDVTVTVTSVDRAGLRATHLDVTRPEPDEGGHHHHHYPALARRLDGSALSAEAKVFAQEVFRHLAEAEAHAHGVPVEKVAFHEVGDFDSVVDVAMAGVCVHRIAADRILASPVKLGRGSIDIAHGTYPVPPPASARLVLGMPVDPTPEAISWDNVELSTPTGLAILKALAPDFVTGWPGGAAVLAQGAGAGSMDLPAYPNVFRTVLFEEAEEEVGSEGSAYATDQVVELRCNVDDQTGERTAWLMETALQRGALDAWVVPLVGKKGRPASCMVLLSKPRDVAGLADFMLRHSASFGVRYSTWDRYKLIRDNEVRETSGGPVSYSVGRTADGERVKEKPEFEDLKKIWESDPDFEG